MNVGQVLYLIRTFNEPTITISGKIFQIGDLIFRDSSIRMTHIATHNNNALSFRSFVTMNFDTIYQDLTIVRNGKTILRIEGDVGEEHLAKSIDELFAN